MQSINTRALMALGLLAGLMIGTGHVGGGLAVAIAAGAAVWLTRSEALKRDTP